MRLAAVLALLMLAGCVTTPSTDTGAGPTPPATVLYAPDCGIAGGSWSEPCLALASPNPSPSKAEIDVAVNPKDPMNVVVGSKDLDKAASDCVWAVPQVSHDGGRTWTTVYIGGKKADRQPADTLYPWQCITDPIMAFDKDGTLFYTLQAYDAQRLPSVPNNPLSPSVGSAMYLARSKTGGDSWDKILLLHAGEGTAVYHDYIRMATNPKTGSVYSLWNQISVAAVVPVLVASRDHGETAAPPTYIPTPDAPAQAIQSGIAVGADGTVYVSLQAGSDVYLTTSTDDAQTFSTPVKVFSVRLEKSPLPNAKFRVGTSVELAVDRATDAGCIHAAWSDAGAGEGDADVLHAKSCDKGKTWSNATRVNRDATKSDQFMPRVAVDDKGAVFVAYLTRAYDPANKLIDGEVAYSTDGGGSWSAKRLTTTSFDGDLGVHQDGFPFLGDYIGIDSSQGRTYVGFPDTATGVAEIAVAALARA